MKKFMKKTKTLIFSTLVFALVTFPVFAADTPSAEELAKMNAAVEQVKATMVAAGATVAMYDVAASLATSSDPAAVIAGKKIEKAADELSSSGGVVSFESLGSRDSMTLASPTTLSTATMPNNRASLFTSSSGSGSAIISSAITPVTSGITFTPSASSKTTTTKFKITKVTSPIIFGP